MKKLVSICVAFGLMACGGKTAKDYSGSYAGTGTTTGKASATLPDGTTISKDLAETSSSPLVLTAPDEVTLTIGSGAGAITFKQDTTDDSTFNLTAISQGQTDAEGNALTISLTTGSLKFTGTSVTQSISGTFSYTKTADDGTPVTATGPLTITFTGTKQ